MQKREDEGSTCNARIDNTFDACTRSGLRGARDAAGIAVRMHDNSVAGTDLLEFANAETLQTDLRMTPFSARKALRLRDAHLQ